MLNVGQEKNWSKPAKLSSNHFLTTNNILWGEICG